MEVEYDMTAEDVFAFQRYHTAHPFKLAAARRKPGYGLVDLGFTGLLVAVFGGLIVTSMLFRSSFPRPDHLIWLGSAVALVVAIGVLTYVRFKAKAIVRQSMLNRQSELDRQRLVLTAEGVVHSSPRGHGVNYWSGIKRLGATDQHLFIYITSVSAYTVPRRAFIDDESFRAFVAEAERLLQDAHAAPGGARWRAATEVLDALPASGPTEQPPQTKGDFAEKPERVQGPERPAKEGREGASPPA
jgi:hypothetical protein